MRASPINNTSEQLTVSSIVTQEQIDDFNNRMKGLMIRLRFDRVRRFTFGDPTNAICM